jgi:hypothetical protein
VRTYYRQGLASYITKADELQPNLMKMGNVDGDATANALLGYLTDPEYSGKFGGALFEAAAGRNWSEEWQHGWDAMMRAYHSLMAHTKACSMSGSVPRSMLRPTSTGRMVYTHGGSWEGSPS